MLESVVQTCGTSRDISSRLVSFRDMSSRLFSVRDLCRPGFWKFRSLDGWGCLVDLVGLSVRLIYGYGCVRTGGTLSLEALARSLGLYLVFGSW